MLTLSERAADALRSAAAAATRFDPTAKIRLRRTDAGLAVELTDAPGDGEAEVSIDGIDLIVGAGLAGTVDTADHNAFVLLP